MRMPALQWVCIAILRIYLATLITPEADATGTLVPAEGTALDHPRRPPEVRTLLKVDVTILGKRIELEAYTCGALYVRLGKRDWFIGEGRAMRASDGGSSLARKTAGVGMVLGVFLATQGTAHAAGGRLSPNRRASPCDGPAVRCGCLGVGLCEREGDVNAVAVATVGLGPDTRTPRREGRRGVMCGEAMKCVGN